MTIETVRQICRALPGVTEDIKWGADLCFSIGGKIFAICDPKGGRRCSFKTTVGAFDVLTRRPGIKPAPYVGRYNWVVIEDLIAVSQGELEALIRESYDLVAARLPARARRRLRSADEEPRGYSWASWRRKRSG